MVILKVEGVDKVIKGLTGFKVNLGRGVERGLKKAGIFLLKRSQEIVPVQTGRLKASGRVRQEGTGLRTDIIVGFFGGKDPKWYAAFVHEIPNPPHAHGREFNIKHAAEIEAAKGTPRGTAQGGMFYRKPEEQFKYLERPVREHRNNILRIIRSEIMKVK